MRVEGPRRQRRVAVELGLHVGGVAADHEVALAEVGDHRHVAGAVARRVGESDRAVAEEVEAAAEGGVGVDPAAVEVDRAVVEGVVEVGAAVAVEQRPRAGRGGVPLGLAEDEGRVGELGDRRGVVDVHVGHHHDRDLTGVEAALAQLRRNVLAGLERRVAEAVAEAAEVLLAVGGDRGVQAGVDEDRAGAGVADQEGGAGDGRRRLAAEQGAQQLQGLEAAARAVPSSSRGQVTWPAIIGSTVTVAPGVPPASGSCSGFGSTLHLHRRLRLPAERPSIGLRRRWLKARIRASSGTVCSRGRSASSPAPAAASGARPRSSWRGSARPWSAAAAARSRWRRRRSWPPAWPASSSTRRSTSATRRRSTASSTACSSATAGSTCSSTTPAASSSPRPSRSRRKASAP